MIFTSYFAKASKVPDAIKIGISLTMPKFFQADATIPVFAPTFEILSEFKRTGNAEVYTSKYLDLLRERDAEIQKRVAILEKIGYNKNVLLCCWETPEKFCHRHILAEYIGKGWTEYFPDIPVKQEIQLEF